MDARAIRPDLYVFAAPIAAACFLALLPAPPVVARVVQNSTDSTAADTAVVLLPEVTVEESRLRLVRELRLRPGFAAQIVVAELPSPTMTLPEALARTAGVNVRQYGGLGAYSAVSVRGSSAAQVAVYLDGVPVTQAQYGVVDLSELPMRSLERVEVYRGAAPLAFQNPGAGVVHLVTRSGAGTDGGTTLSLGEYATRRADLWGTYGTDPLRLFGTYRFQRSTGDFDFLDDNGTPLNEGDDEVASRRNNAFHEHGATLKAELAAAGRFTALVDGLVKRAGMPGISSYQTDDARFSTDRGVATLAWRSPAWTPANLELESRAYGVWARDRLVDRDNELGSGVQDTDDRSASWGWRQQAEARFGPAAHTAIALAEVKREEFRPESRGMRGPTSRRDVLSLGLEDRIAPAQGRLTLNGSLRHERTWDDFPAGPSYAGAPRRPALARELHTTNAALGARASIGRGVWARVNTSRGERLPSLFELYGNRGTVLGNRTLLPERLDHRDAGLGWEGRIGGSPATVELAAFRSDARDLIVFVQNSQYASVAQNVSAARLEGIELALAWRHRRVALQANWTHQETRDRSEVPFWRGRQLPGRPEDEISTRLECTLGRFGAFHEFHFAAGNFLDRANRQSVAARRIHDAGVHADIGQLRVTAEVRNLGDDRVRDAAAYPLPGRTASLSAEIRL